MPNWTKHFAGFSAEIQALLRPLAEAYDECMREWAKNPRYLQKREYHTSALPIVLSPWSVRSPFAPDLWNLGVAWYVPRCEPVRAYGR
jgi:hypothetical protein